jgi:type I restriction enzyme S subunit
MSPNTTPDSLQEVPSSYSTQPLKYGVDRISKKIEDISDDCPRISLADVEAWKGRLIDGIDETEGDISQGVVEFQENDVLFNKLRPYLAKVLKAEYRGVASPEFIVLRPRNFDPDFLQYTLISKEFVDRVDAATYGAGMPRASWDFIGSIQIPCPPIQLQKDIARYLDSAIVQLDNDIKRIEKLIALLNERREAIIEDIILQGVGDLELEVDERLAVLRKRPLGWKVRRAKTLFNQRDDRGHDDLPLLEVSLNHGVRLREENKDRNAWTASDLEDMKRVAEDDLVFNKMRLWQGAIGRSDYEGLVSPDYTVLKPRPEANPTYYEHLLRTRAYKTEVNRRSYGVVDDRNRIYWKQFGDMPLLHPSLDEQAEIVDHIERSTEEIDELREKVNDAIALLEEKRQALITAAVSGQIDLSDWQPPDEQEALA